MSFKEWRQSYLKHCDTFAPGVERDLRLARLVNLEAETRIDHLKTEFVDLLVANYDRKVVSGLAAALAAERALAETTWSAWLAPQFKFTLPSPSQSVDMSTYVTASDLAQAGGLGDLDTDDVPAAVSLPNGVIFDASRKFMVWLCPDLCPDDPDRVACGLGLPHFQNEVVYRFSIHTDGFDLCIPSCFDARLYEAWEFPPGTAVAHGMTRDVETAQRTFRELVVRTDQTDGQFAKGFRVPASAPVQKVKTMRPEYMAGRTL